MLYCFKKKKKMKPRWKRNGKTNGSYKQKVNGTTNEYGGRSRPFEHVVIVYDNMESCTAIHSRTWRARGGRN